MVQEAKKQAWRSSQVFFIYISTYIYIYIIYTHINWSRIFFISSALLINPFYSSCNQLISWDPPSGCNRQQADLITFFGRPEIPVYKSSLCHEPASMVLLPNVCINTLHYIYIYTHIYICIYIYICMCINIRIYHTVYEHHFVHLYSYIVYIILYICN